MGELSLDAILSRYRQALAQRRGWEALWRDCFTFALPHRGYGFGSEFDAARNHAERVFDGTAADAVEQLAASLLAGLTPPWSQWFSLTPGTAIDPLERAVLAESLDHVTGIVQAHFDRSNFAVEMHQAFLDLVTIGGATLLFEEAPLGALSAFNFCAVPISEMILEPGANGRIDGHFRRTRLPLAGFCQRFPNAEPPRRPPEPGADDRAAKLDVLEAVLPQDNGYGYHALHLEADGARVLACGRFDTSPFISFRWLKGAAEVYGRSPIMTALPDIKTVNKVVELVLKNASIAVTGIWQADDDGVLNPATVRLVPGTIIPKAVGSSGLTPLQAPGRFDVSNLMLDDLRSRIRHTLLVDRLAPVSGQRMTATEVLERSQEMSRLLGATYGRLQAELLTPLITRALAILRRRGEIPDIVLDGKVVDLQYKSPLARSQARDDIQNTLLWLEATAQMGPEARRVVNLPETARWLGNRLGVPGSLINDLHPLEELIEDLRGEAEAS